MKTSNPAFARDIYETTATPISTRAVTGSGAMTIGGTVAKSLLLTGLALFGAYLAWFGPLLDYLTVPQVLYGGLIGGLVTAMVIIFKREMAPTLAPVYAVCEGVSLGVLSMLFERRAPGVAPQALLATFGTLAAFLTIYRFGIIKVTERLRLGIASAMLGIMLTYLIDLVGGMFGYPLGVLRSNSPLGLIISVFTTGVAAFNLLIDFDSIEQGVRSRAPKHMEWYGAFGLLMTLVWLYLEMLRLLSKLNRR